MEESGESREPKVRVLVVDDEPSIVNMLCEMLVSQGYEPRGCTGGREAMSALQESPFDAIISDLKMPDVSGTELMQHACEKYPTLPLSS